MNTAGNSQHRNYWAPGLALKLQPHLRGCCQWAAFGLAVQLLLQSSPLHAQSASLQSPSLVENEEIAFGRAVASVAQSVVQIETFGGLERVDAELVAEGPTTGTIVDKDGWIVSSLFNFRQQPASILVTLPSGQRAAARIVARDFSREIALLKVETDDDLPVPPFAPKSDAAVGHWTIALGKTYNKQTVSQTVGIISAVGRAYDKAVQTDAKISPINYGGPLIDISGQVIGILSPISPGTFLEGDSSQLYDSGVGFAIPIEDILARLPAMKAGQDVHSGKLGIVSADQNELMGPVRISGTAPGSPAAKALFKAGDVVVQAGGKPVSLLAHLRHALGPVDAGQSLPIVVERGGQRLTLEPVLTEEIPVYRRRYIGLRLAQRDAGVQILSIEPNSPAAQTELAIGQIITHCNGEAISKISELQQQIAVLELDQPLKLEISADDSSPTRPADAQPIPTKSVEIFATVWPQQFAESLPAIDPQIEEGMQTEIVDVLLGDFPNKSYAIVPPLSDVRDLGLLIVFPEPGELEREKTQAYWSDFCRDYGWIVAVVNSGNPRGWSREEVELAGRVIGRLDKNYRIDKLRTAIVGLGVGGQIALGASLSELRRVSGVITCGTSLAGFKWPKPNSPLQSLDFLMLGDLAQLGPVAEQLSDMGYVANTLAAPNLELSKWETIPKQTLQAWLEGLGRL